jgi:hypothetical protein
MTTTKEPMTPVELYLTRRSRIILLVMLVVVCLWYFLSP